ncbi:hypothetical protein LRR80_05587 [Streptomyces sp. RO-S4]|nr:hypothetical protein [Streptomyces sp. RO-S4]
MLFGPANTAFLLAMYTMSPPSRWAVITRAASRDTRKDPRAMTSCWTSQSFADVSSNGLEREIPALFTTRSTPPKASTAAWNAAAICSSSVTSTVTATALSGPPSSCATRAAFSPCRSATTTHAPSAASRRAMAFPIPLPAPVTSATRVASGFGGGIRRSLASSRAQYSMRNFSDSSIGAYVETASAPRITLIALR